MLRRFFCLWFIIFTNLKDSNKYNVLFTSSWYPTRVHATLGNFVQRHAEAVSILHNVYVLHVMPDDSIKNSIEVSYQSINQIDTIVVYFKRKALKHLSYLKAFKKGVDFLFREKGVKIDLVHHNVTLPAGWQALWLKRKYNLPYLVSEHWNGFHDERNIKLNFFQQRLAQRTIAKSSFVCPVTDHLGKSMRDRGLVGNYEIVSNVVDTELFQLKEIKRAPFKFLHVSTLVDDHKNVSGILRAAKKALDQTPDLHFTIVGDGDTAPHIAYAKELGIPESNLSILGEQPLSEIAGLMEKSNALILFSNYENFPCVIPEAMACGMPVISSDVGGIREHINKNNGRLVQAKDEEGLLEALLEVESNQVDFDPKSIREYSENHFSRLSIAGQFDELYQKMKA